MRIWRGTEKKGRGGICWWGYDVEWGAAKLSNGVQLHCCNPSTVEVFNL